MLRKLVLATLVMLAVSACNRTQPEGPAERAGRKIDNAADKVHDDAVRTGENAKEIGRDVADRIDPDRTAYENRKRK